MINKEAHRMYGAPCNKLKKVEHSMKPCPTVSTPMIATDAYVRFARPSMWACRIERTPTRHMTVGTEMMVVLTARCRETSCCHENG